MIPVPVASRGSSMASGAYRPRAALSMKALTILPKINALHSYTTHCLRGERQHAIHPIVLCAVRAVS